VHGLRLTVDGENKNSKHQITNKLQFPMTQTKKKHCEGLCFGHWDLELGIYLEFGAWILVL
jgi:hypothetical protein